MKNIALCFDQSGYRGNAAALGELLCRPDRQIVWSSIGTTGDQSPVRSLRRRRAREVDVARAHVVEAYEYLAEHWESGDRVFVFGAGRGGYCARALTRLLGTVGVLSSTADAPAPELREYVLATYAVPRTPREPADWQRVGRLAAALSGCADASVGVEFLGLWDTLGVPGLPRRSGPDPLSRVGAARHALAIDARVAPVPLGHTGPEVEEVWFRGAHCDITRGRHACAPLADIALDWVLDGAVAAGLEVADAARHQTPAPCAVDALAGSTHPVSLRRIPAGAAVHASVNCYLRAHPSYWRRLPACIEWADPDWVARGERLMAAPSPIETSAAQPELASAS
ncbi:putative alpha/beta hydrolase family protein DUF2235 [Mycobacterium sp. BK558]|nr:putative alpha/beta hydrolase family protein DUF2235 [Mycobacterium sp. BK558]